jgi:hypothetical protein
VPSEVGTLAWARRTNGILTRAERARYVAAAAREQARVAVPLLAFRLGRTAGRTAQLDDAALRIPDSAVARDAVEACAELMTPVLVEHSQRSFIFARALGALAGIEHDEELLFVATMFHDAGAMKPDLTDGGRCFTLNSAAAAETHARAAGWTTERVHAAAEAITLHLNPSVPPSQGPEAHLMHDGVLLDAVGLRAWQLDRAGIERVRAQHPRLGFSQEGARVLSEQGRAIPGCRAGVAMSSGFALALKLGPWQD